MPTDRLLFYSTYLGVAPLIIGEAIALYTAGNAYVAADLLYRLPHHPRLLPSY